MKFIFITNFLTITDDATMTILMVGSDSLNTLPDQLRKRGNTQIIHWNGRKARHLAAPIPRGVGAIVLLTGAVTHDVVQAIRRAQHRGVRVIFARRSRASIEHSLKILLGEDAP